MAQAHTARFLQTFHSAQTTAQRTAASETDAPTDHADTDPAALAFVRGQAALRSNPAPVAQTDGSYVCEISGHKVRCGGAFITERQAKWIIDIATTRETPGPAEAVLVRLEQGFARSAGSQFITNYKDLPRKSADTDKMREAEYPAPAAPGEALAVVKTRPEVADGRYAVEDEDGTLKFYKLKNGRKAGYVFLDVQASDDWFAIRNPRRIDAVLAAIVEAGELNAARRYGIELGKCSRCGRTLTDETSRAYGIGPDCRAK